ncbi:hypothetical protein DL96DRAFT_1712511 [Flagelloscypha sp. PMI_526]|nr:hypothetical protein DL96DRAFT_1712511 [Flagelloscypha sp. PMI_526]
MAGSSSSSEGFVPELLRLLGPTLNSSSQSPDKIPLAEAVEMKDAANRLFRQGNLEAKLKASCLYQRIASATLIPEDTRLTRIAYCNAAQAYFDTGIPLKVLDVFPHVVRLEPKNPLYDDRLLTAKAYVRGAKAMCALNRYDEALKMLESATECNVDLPQFEEIHARILDTKGRWPKPVPGPGELLWNYRAVLTSERYYDLQIALPYNFAEMNRQNAIELLKGVYKMTEKWFKETGDVICRVCGVSSTSGLFRHAEVISEPPSKVILVTVMPCCSRSCRVKAKGIDVGWGTAL